MNALIQWLLSLYKKVSSKPTTPASPTTPTTAAPTASTTTTPRYSMRISKDGLDLIKYYESLRLNAYLDVKGVPTIGYGDTGPHVQMGQTITAAEAEQRLMKRLRDEFEPGVLKVLTRKPDQFEFDAMVSLAYNIGVGAFQKSTLVKKFNAGDIAGAADQFLVWTRAGNEHPRGLKRRRASERCLFLKWGIEAALTYGKTAA